MDDARERVRRRFKQWFEASGLKQRELGERLRRDQPSVSKLLAYGPRLEDLDLVCAATGLDPSALVATSDADQDDPHDSTERELLRWYRLATPAQRDAVVVLLRAAHASSLLARRSHEAPVFEAPLRVLSSVPGHRPDRDDADG